MTPTTPNTPTPATDAPARASSTQPERRPQLGFILKGYPRISETFIAGEIGLLESLGFDIHIISMRQPREAFTHECVKRIRAQVSYLPEHLFRALPRLLYHNLQLFLKHPRRYRAALRHLRERLGGSSSAKASVKHLLQGGLLVHAVLPRTHIAHFHAHFAHSPSSVAQYASILSGLPFSFTAHAKDIYTQKPERLAAKMAEAHFVVTCTRYNREHLQKLAAAHGAAIPVECVYHGIDLSLFAMNGRPVEAAPPYEILTVARFVAKKGLFDILRALEQLAEEGLALRWTVVGEGELRGELEQAVAASPLRDRVTLAGALAHEDVLQLYRKAHCFALGCKIARNGDRDGIPNVVAEALAMGVPVAAPAVSGVPELVEHEHTGLLAAPEDPASLAQAIRRCCEDAALRAVVIPAGRAKVETVFDNTRTIRELAKIYQEHTPTGAGLDLAVPLRPNQRDACGL